MQSQYLLLLFLGVLPETLARQLFVVDVQKLVKRAVGRPHASVWLHSHHHRFHLVLFAEDLVGVQHYCCGSASRQNIGGKHRVDPLVLQSVLGEGNTHAQGRWEGHRDGHCNQIDVEQEQCGSRVVF